MSDIGLLMAGVFMTEQPSVPYLPEPPVEQENAVEATEVRMAQVIPKAEITPPEFIEPDNLPPIAPNVLTHKNHNALEKIKKKLNGLRCCRIDSVPDVVLPKQPTHTESIPSENDLGAAGRQPQIAETIVVPSRSQSGSLPDRKNAVTISYNMLQKFVGGSQEAQLLITNGDFQQLSVRGDRRYINVALPVLEFGHSGLAVKVLQRLLLANGYRIHVDGVYGALTETAVKAFQYQHDISVDGVVGQSTWEALTN